MSDTPPPELVARLRSLADQGERAYYTPSFITSAITAAADRIEALAAERDTLAEMVRLFDPWVTLRVAGHGPYLANRRPAPGEHITLTPEQAERFRAVLDRIYREAETDE